ncbi:bacteriocin-like protein [Chryseobacterium sp. G0201]|nr:hypothetical protein [Chryseobacterium sp. G0201]
MKNLRKLSKKDMKSIQGSIPECLAGYYWCNITRKCIPFGTSCGISIE